MFRGEEYRPPSPPALLAEELLPAASCRARSAATSRRASRRRREDWAAASSSTARNPGPGTRWLPPTTADWCISPSTFFTAHHPPSPPRSRAAKTAPKAPEPRSPRTSNRASKESLPPGAWNPSCWTSTPSRRHTSVVDEISEGVSEGAGLLRPCSRGAGCCLSNEEGSFLPFCPRGRGSHAQEDGVRTACSSST